MIEVSNVRGVIFDLDGTLISSSLDFALIRQQIGCPEGRDLLQFIEQMSLETDRIKASNIVIQHEIEDALSANWLSGAREFIDYLAEENMPMAIVTRNSPQATMLKIRNNEVPIELVLTRDDAPAKPKPDALLMIAKQWQIPPQELLYVGDYIYDELAAKNAGMSFHYSPFGSM